jgi:RISC-loading complex subunit TARBP2
LFLQGAAKTPVSLLQELYVKKGINPKYDLIQIEGAIHEPTFKYRVSVGELVGK